MSDHHEILLNSPRLVLRTHRESDRAKLQYFDEINLSRLSPWSSYTSRQNLDYKAQIARWELEFKEGRSIRFLLFLKENPDGPILGFCNLTQIFRGPFQACYLGYQIDQTHEGKGFMSEAVEKAVQYMFEVQKIHRIMANYMPSNERSARLLCKLGFVIEGTAKDYLIVNGKWEDHVLTSLTNHKWLPEL